MIVVDASVLATALADDDTDGDVARARLMGAALIAPELIDLEVLSVLRRHVFAATLPMRRAAQARTDLIELPIRRVAHRHLIDRCWELRDNLTPYDAAYVAVAEAFGATLLTADARLARAPGVQCRCELLHSAS